MAVVLANFGSLGNMLRLWTVIFVSNLIGLVLFAAVAVNGDVLPASPFTVLFEEVAQQLDHGFWGTTLKAGWSPSCLDSCRLQGHHLPDVPYLRAGLPYPG